MSPSKFDPKKHHRRSIRLQGYDYTQAGTYYVTIVTYQRDCLFGKIENEEMLLSDFGAIANECWIAIPDHFPNVELGAYVIMPNHVHGIILIRADESRSNPGMIDDDGRRGAIYRAPTVEQFGKPTIGSLPTIIRTYKAAVTRRIGREHNATGIWQRNYYEHIIRNETDLQNKTDYIEANPMLWDVDDNNPINHGL